jgi:uncharacterized protein (TIGR00725 family)
MIVRKMRIGVMGAGQCSKEIYSLAEQVGELLAQHGAILICGGCGGVMEAAAKGAKAVGGITVGILPDEDDLRANPYIDIPIVTGMGNGRNVINVLSSQAIIAISGGYGTLSEIALALKTQIPVVGLRTWNFSAETEPANKKHLFFLANTADEAVKKAVELAQ